MKLLVFDLDQTLWWCDNIWIDQSAGGPFKRISHDLLTDRSGKELGLFKESRQILQDLRDAGYEMVVASRSKTPQWAKEAMDKLEITEFFSRIYIYPGTKLKHFREIRESCGTAYEEMIFFDDEERNITEISGLGVETVFITSGINKDVVNSVLGCDAVKD